MHFSFGILVLLPSRFHDKLFSIAIFSFVLVISSRPIILRLLTLDSAKRTLLAI